MDEQRKLWTAEELGFYQPNLSYQDYLRAGVRRDCHQTVWVNERRIYPQLDYGDTT